MRHFVGVSLEVRFKILPTGTLKYGGSEAEWDNKLLVYTHDVSLASSSSIPLARNRSIEQP
jgi:hypothetical protein